jgi:hypothetical protein
VTLLACCFALIPLLGLPAEMRRTLVLSDTTQVGLHPSAVATNGTAVDFETMPSAVLTFPYHRSAFTLSYTPRFTLYDAFGTTEAQWLQLHTGTLGYSYSTRRYNFTLAESVSVGTQNFSSLSYTSAVAANPGAAPDPTAPNVNPIAASTTVDILAEQTSASFSVRWTREWLSSVYGSYGISGGRTDESQNLLPKTKTTNVGTALEYTLSKRDHLSTTASVAFSNTSAVAFSTTSTGFEHRIIQAAEVWAHNFNRALSGSLSVGVVHDSTTTQGVDTSQTSPTAAAGLTGYLVRRSQFQVSLTLGTSYGLVLNPFTGGLQERLQWLSLLSVRKNKTTLAVLLDGAQTFPPDDDGAVSVIGLGFVLTQNLSKLVSVSGGYRRIWQSATLPNGTTLPDQWYAFAGVTIYAPPISL